MATSDTDEQITLSSTDFDQFKDDDVPTKVTKELSQAVKIKEHLKLVRIFDSKFINVNEKTADGIKSYVFKLSMLDEKPVRRRIIKFLPLLTGCGLLVVAWIIYWLKQTGLPLLVSPYIYTAIAALAALGLILIVYVIKEFRNVLVFYSQHGRIPIVELLYRIPDKLQFNEFIQEIVKNINNEKKKSPYTESQLLAAELSEHRKLRDNGGISSNTYETAKANIMAFH